VKYKTVIPSLGKEVEYRPYLVKEEKILMIALESNDQKQILTAIKDVINNCLYDDINLNKLAMFDIETLFLRLRSKSVGETTEIKAKCEECEHEHLQEINFDDIQPPEIKKVVTKIELTDDVGMTLKYPSIGDIQKHDSDKMESVEGMMEVVVDCIESIYDADNVYSAKDESRKSLKEFIDSLNSQQFSKLTDFFENVPALNYNLNFECSKCGHKNEIELRGLQNFFG
jgi:ribosomal protein L44E